MNPDFTGKWKADLRNSRLLGPAPKGLLITIFHYEPELRVNMAIALSNQNTQHVDFQARTTGESTVNLVLGATWESRLRWIGSELLIESRVNQSGREMHLCDYWSLSSDHRVLTMEHRNDDLPGQITVLDKVEADCC
jgi:hypothetical protein